MIPSRTCTCSRIAVIALLAAWMGAIAIALALCVTAARGDRYTLGAGERARVHSGRFMRTVAR